MLQGAYLRIAAAPSPSDFVPADKQYSITQLCRQALAGAMAGSRWARLTVREVVILALVCGTILIMAAAMAFQFVLQ